MSDRHDSLSARRMKHDLVHFVRWSFALVAGLWMVAGQHLGLLRTAPHERSVRDAARPSFAHAPVTRVPMPPRAPASAVHVVPWRLVPGALETVADGLAKDQGALIRMRALAAEASQGTLNTIERAALNVLYQAHQRLIDNIAVATRLGDIALLTGEHDLILQGPRAGASVYYDLPDATAAGYEVEGTALLTLTNASASIPYLDASLRKVFDHRVALLSAWNQVRN